MTIHDEAPRIDATSDEHSPAEPISPTLDYFRDLTDRSLTVSDLDGQPLTSVTCSLVDDRGEHGGLHMFRVEFEGPLQPVLDQGTLVFQAAKQPAAIVFVTPIGSTETRLKYEAVFNQAAQ